MKRTVHVRVAGDLPNEIALPEDLAADAHKLIGVRCVRQIVGGLPV
jgi:hypothetical protein